MKKQTVLLLAGILLSISNILGSNVCLANREDPLLNTPDARAKIEKIRDEFLSRPSVASFWKANMLNETRHGLERDVVLFLQAQPWYAQLRVDLLQMLKPQVDAIEVELNNRMALASKGGPKGELHAMVEELAKGLFFTPAEREKASVYVNRTNDVNAFTISPDRILYVLFSGLIEDFHKMAQEIYEYEVKKGKTPESAIEIAKNAIASVSAHELAHIAYEHVMHNLMAVTVFLATGLNVIDVATNIKEEEKKELTQQFVASLHDELGRGLNRTFATRKSNCRFKHECDDVEIYPLDSMFGDILNLAAKLLNKVGEDELVPSMAPLLHIFRKYEKGGLAPMKMAEADEQEGPPITLEDVMKMKKRLVDLGRAFEITADNAAQRVKGTRAAIHAEMSLMGVSSEEDLAIQAKRQPILISAVPSSRDEISNGDHPGTLDRTQNFPNNEKNDMFLKIYTNAYLFALHNYFVVALKLEAIQREQDQGGGELVDQNSAAVHRKELEELEKSLVSVVMENLVKDLDDPSRQFDVILQTAKYLGFREGVREGMSARSKWGRGIAYRTNLEHGFFAQLKTEFEKRMQDLQTSVNEQIEKLEAIAEAEMKKAKTEEQRARIQAALEQMSEHVVEQAKEKAQVLGGAVNELFAYAPESPINQAKERIAELAGEFGEISSRKPVDFCADFLREIRGNNEDDSHSRRRSNRRS
ncbi:MAG: M48 family metalloprotease [Bacteriovoracia bacterium]